MENFIPSYQVQIIDKIQNQSGEDPYFTICVLDHQNLPEPFKCGHYESDSSGYRNNPNLVASMMREYFPKTIRKSPNQPKSNN